LHTHWQVLGVRDLLTLVSSRLEGALLHCPGLMSPWVPVMSGASHLFAYSLAIGHLYLFGGWPPPPWLCSVEKKVACRGSVWPCGVARAHVLSKHRVPEAPLPEQRHQQESLFSLQIHQCPRSSSRGTQIPAECRGRRGTRCCCPAPCRSCWPGTRCRWSSRRRRRGCFSSMWNMRSPARCLGVGGEGQPGLGHGGREGTVSAPRRGTVQSLMAQSAGPRPGRNLLSGTSADRASLVRAVILGTPCRGLVALVAGLARAVPTPPHGDAVSCGWAVVVVLGVWHPCGLSSDGLSVPLFSVVSTMVWLGWIWGVLFWGECAMS
jgi:hypothetical protein